MAVELHDAVLICPPSSLLFKDVQVSHQPFQNAPKMP